MTQKTNPQEQEVKELKGIIESVEFLQIATLTDSGTFHLARKILAAGYGKQGIPSIIREKAEILKHSLCDVSRAIGVEILTALNESKEQGIKPLEFHKSSRTYWVAETPIGEYQITEHGESSFTVWLNHGSIQERLSTFKAAESFANTHHQSLVKSCLL
jgi:hypothetical protein